MKIKTPTPFETFSDGYCAVYTVKGNQLDKVKIPKLPFGEQTIGARRHYAARAASIRIDRAVRVPLMREIEANDRAVIDSIIYQLEQVQHISDTNPPITVLTMRKYGILPDMEGKP
ncbi:MAG: hypothetical protein ACOX60_06325 [Massiliimalia sp.]